MKPERKGTGRAALFAVLTPAAVLLSQGINLPFIDLVSLFCIVGSCVLYSLSAVLYPSALLLIAAVLSPALKLAFGGTIVQAFASLVYIPAGIALALAVLKKKKRTPALIGVSLGLAGYTLIIFALDIVIKKHTLYMSAIKEYIADAFNSLAELLVSMSGTLLTFYSMQGVVDGGITDEYIESYVKQLRMLLPGLYATASIILAFIITGLFAAVLRRTGGEKLLPDKEWLFTMSPISALIMMGAYYAGMVTNAYSVEGLTAINLVYMLTPGFYALGIRSLSTSIKRSTNYPSSVRTIVGILAFMVSVTFPVLITIFIFVGVWSVLTKEIKKLAKKFTSE